MRTTTPALGRPPSGAADSGESPGARLRELSVSITEDREERHARTAAEPPDKSRCPAGRVEKAGAARFLGPGGIAVITVAAILTLRSLAEYGRGSIFFCVVGALFFLIPLAFVAAGLTTAWPRAGGMHVWVKQGSRGGDGPVLPYLLALQALDLRFPGFIHDIRGVEHGPSRCPANLDLPPGACSDHRLTPQSAIQPVSRLQKGDLDV